MKGKLAPKGENGGGMRANLPSCPFCARPEMFEPREQTAVNFAPGLSRATAHLSGKYWDRGEPGRFRSLRSFRETLFKDGERRFKIEGAKNFTPPYQGFDIEVIGLPLPFRPMQSAGPGFHVLGPNKIGNDPTLIWYNAARVTHRATGVVADAHAWESHGLLVTVRNLPKNPTGEAIKAASTLFVFFSVEYRGEPKITRDRLMDVLAQLAPDDRTQAKTARKLGVTERALRAWAEREGFETWAEVREAFEPYKPAEEITS